jgi:hypothetical protein
MRHVFYVIGQAMNGKQLYPETLDLIPKGPGSVLLDHLVTISHISGKVLGQRKGQYFVEIEGPRFIGRWVFLSGELEKLCPSATAPADY